MIVPSDFQFGMVEGNAGWNLATMFLFWLDWKYLKYCWKHTFSNVQYSSSLRFPRPRCLLLCQPIEEKGTEWAPTGHKSGAAVGSMLGVSFGFKPCVKAYDPRLAGGLGHFDTCCFFLVWKYQPQLTFIFFRGGGIPPTSIYVRQCRNIMGIAKTKSRANEFWLISRFFHYSEGTGMMNSHVM